MAHNLATGPGGGGTVGCADIVVSDESGGPWRTVPPLSGAQYQRWYPIATIATRTVTLHRNLARGRYPSHLQWCRRLVIVNFSQQPEHAAASELGCHTAAAAAAAPPLVLVPPPPAPPAPPPPAPPLISAAAPESMSVEPQQALMAATHSRIWAASVAVTTKLMGDIKVRTGSGKEGD